MKNLDLNAVFMTYPDFLNAF